MPDSQVFDAVVAGGSFAGLSAALYLARARRRVAVIDAGEPRNRFAHASHGFFSRDGAAPGDMLAIAREQLLAYPTASMRTGRVTRIERVESELFRAELESGESVMSRRIVLATGIVDILPEVPGLKERWGSTVLHCPYCHGYEFGGQRLGVLGTGAMSLHQAELITDWGGVTLFVDGKVLLDDAVRSHLVARGITIEETPVAGLEGASPTLAGVRLQDGRLVPLDALFVAAQTRPASSLAEGLGCEIEQGPLGPFIRTDGVQRTSVPGVCAAGDTARARHSVSFAVADGVSAGLATHQSLLFGLGRP